MNTKRLIYFVRKATVSCFGSGTFDEKRAQRLLTEFKKSSSYESMVALKEFKNVLSREMRKRTLLIESVIPLSPAILKTIQTQFRKEVMKTETTINPSLLGGVRVTIGDNRYDFSLANKMQQLKETIAG